MNIRNLIYLFWSLLGKDVKTDYQSKHPDADKPIFLHRHKLAYGVTGVGIIAGLLGGNIDVAPSVLLEHLIKLSDAGVDILKILYGVKGSLLIMWGVVLYLASLIKAQINKSKEVMK